MFEVFAMAVAFVCVGGGASYAVCESLYSRVFPMTIDVEAPL